MFKIVKELVKKASNMLQDALQHNPTSAKLHRHEKDILDDYVMFRHIEDKIFQQTSKEGFMKERDDDGKYYHHVIKRKRCYNFKQLSQNYKVAQC